VEISKVSPSTNPNSCHKVAYKPTATTRANGYVYSVYNMFINT
jgi:hypothetical protein